LPQVSEGYFGAPIGRADRDEEAQVDRPGRKRHGAARPGQDRPAEDPVGVRPGAQRITQVLAGLRYPAAKWQILAEADHYGADSTSLAQLWTLSAGTYRNLGSVLAELGLVGRTPADGPESRTPPRPRR
jgi:hypothetical protein